MIREDDIQTEAIGSFSKKDKLEQALAIGIDRAPELKQDEKMHFLGEFKERVIRMLSKKQVANPLISPEITDALQDKRTVKMLINGDLNRKFTDKYIKLARELDKAFTVVHNPELIGETGLVVISDQAVDINKIEVDDVPTA